MGHKPEYRNPPHKKGSWQWVDNDNNHLEEEYSRACLMTTLYVAMSVPFCLPHPVAVSDFVICRGLCVCTEIL